MFQGALGAQRANCHKRHLYKKNPKDFVILDYAFTYILDYLIENIVQI